MQLFISNMFFLFQQMGLLLTLVTLTSTEVAPNYAVEYSYPYRSGSPGIGYNLAPHEYHYVYHTNPQYNTLSYSPEPSSVNSGFKRINLGLTSNELGLASNNIGIVSHNTGLANNARLTPTYPGLATDNTGLTSQHLGQGSFAPHNNELTFQNKGLRSFASINPRLASNYAGFTPYRPGLAPYNSGLSPTGLYSYKIPIVKAQTAPVARYLAVPLTLHRNHYSLPGRKQNFNYYSPIVKPYTIQDNGLQFVR